MLDAVHDRPCDAEKRVSEVRKMFFLLVLDMAMFGFHDGFWGSKSLKVFLCFVIFSVCTNAIFWMSRDVVTSRSGCQYLLHTTAYLFFLLAMSHRRQLLQPYAHAF